MQAWDLLVLLVVIYTTFMTPFQVAFLAETPVSIFALNRIVDCILLVDMVLHMFLVYQTRSSSSRAGTWVTNRSKIWWNYLAGWFLIDFIGLASSLVEIIDYVNIGGVDARLLRLLQAVRCLRAIRLARVLQRAADALMLIIGGLPGQVGFIGGEFFLWLIKLITISHVVACILGFLAMAKEGNVTWLKALERSKNLEIDRSEPMQTYLFSLYWATTILLTIGFGDITPVTLTEHAVLVVVMVIGGLSWTLLMATACSLAGARDAARLEHGMNVDTLLGMCHDHKLPSDLTERLVHFLVKSRRMQLLAEQQELMSRMSPSLQSEVAVHITEKHLCRVDFLRNTEAAFTVALASSLTLQIFPPKEWIVPHELSQHLQVGTERRFSTRAPTMQSESEDQGPVLKGKLDRRHCPHLTMLEGGIASLVHIKCAGSCWHKDFILSGSHLRDQEVARSVVYSSVYTLSREVLFSVVEAEKFAKARQLLRRAAIQLALARTLQRAALVAHLHDNSLLTASLNVLEGELELRKVKAGDKKRRACGKLHVAIKPLEPLEDERQDLLPLLTDLQQEMSEVKAWRAAADQKLNMILTLLTSHNNRRPADCSGVCWAQQVT